MAKFADIEPFYDWLTELMRRDTSSHPDHNTLMFYEIMDTLDSLPEVVRCKDCKHWTKCYSSLIGEAMCCTGQGSANILKAPSDFCSYGERREGE